MKCYLKYLAQRFPAPQTQPQLQSLSGQQCIQNGMPGLQWTQWGRQSWWSTRWNTPSHSSNQWAARAQTEPSRTQSGSAWRSQSRMASFLPHTHHHHHPLRKWKNKRRLEWWIGSLFPVKRRAVLVLQGTAVCDKHHCYTEWLTSGGRTPEWSSEDRKSSIISVWPNITLSKTSYIKTVIYFKQKNNLARFMPGYYLNNKGWNNKRRCCIVNVKGSIRCFRLW